MYRVISPVTVLKTGRNIPAGTLSTLEDISDHGCAVLLHKGIIAEVEGPPLAVLPGWETLAEQLEAFSIATVVDLLEADYESLSIGLGVSAADVAAWQEEAKQFVT